MPAGKAAPPHILTITGPTAVGKTALSLHMASLLDAEIVSVDSRQIYKELDIGTAKPTEDELNTVRHHFIGEISIEEPVSAGQYALMAEKRIADILSRGKVPLLIGGSTLYLHALHHGMADIPEVDDAIREEIAARLQREGSEKLYRELVEVDPEAARTMDMTKSQRLIRALAVYRATGRPLSWFHAQSHPPRFKYKTIVLHLDREILYRRIEQRVDLMLESGLVDEVGGLMGQGLDLTMPVLKTIGYREVIEHLQGVHDHSEMVRLIKRNSRRYAKRQLTWFRRYPDYEWLDRNATNEELVNGILSVLAA